LTKSFTIYNSSAGSGKTETLAREYLKIVLNDPDEFKSILAVTFTNKAAGEMRQRILDRLSELAEGRNPEFEKSLKNMGVVVNIKEQARIALQLIIHNYSFFSVSTLDSFFHRIFRSFARELKQKFGYEIMLEEKEALAAAVDELCAGIGSDEKLTGYLCNFAFYALDENKSWSIDYTIKKQADEIFRERYKKLRDSGLATERETIEQILEQLHRVVRNFEKQMKQSGKQAVELIESCGLCGDDFYYKFGNYYYNITEDINYPDKKKIELNLRMEAAADGSGKWFADSSSKKSQIRKCVEAGLGKLSRQIVKFYRENERAYFTSVCLFKMIHTMGLFRDIHQKLNEFRDNNHVVLISDINDLLQSIVQNSSDAPFIYEKIGARYKHFLIDEFQDTSAVQWSNLKPLIVNSIAEGGGSMIVGDIKQSIFRWRNGDLKLLLETAENDLAPFRELVKKKSLTENRRSNKNIIRFNNDFFTLASEMIVNKLSGKSNGFVERVYAPDEVRQQCSKADDGGYVRIEFLSSGSNGAPPAVPAAGQARQGGSDNHDPEFSLADRRLLETIRELQRDGFPLKSITILVRFNREGRHVASLLAGNGINVISAESLLVSSSPQVRFLLSLLRWLVNPQNRLAAAEATYQYETYVGRNPFRLNDVNRYSLLDMPLYDAVESLIARFGLNKDANTYLLKFLELVLDFSVSRSSLIQEFLNWWDSVDKEGEKFSITVPEQENAVRVMTIHKAKGLKNEVIIVPYANWSLGIGWPPNPMWVKSDNSPFSESPAYLVQAAKNLEGTFFDEQYSEELVLTHVDNLNLLYVAFTRPVQRLYVFTNAGGIGKLIREVLVLHPLLSKHHDPQIDVFEYGINLHSLKAGAKQRPRPGGRAGAMTSSIIQIDSFVSEDAKSKAVLKKSPVPLQVFQPEAMDEDTPDGSVFHYAMSLIKTAADIDPAVQTLVNEGIIPESEAAKLKKIISAVVSHPEIKNWFTSDWKVKTEAELLTPEGEILRPDRIMFGDSATVIIDYKTGAPKPEHKTRLLEYAAALRRAGYTNIEKYLIYVKEKRVLSINDTNDLQV
jgi:ATP-dependent helicase/nuclease subunit A